MSDVEFDEDSLGSTETGPASRLKNRLEHKPSFFVRWLLKMNIIKSEEQAIYIFLCLAFICILGAVFIFYKSYREGPFRPQSPYELPPSTNK